MFGGLVICGLLLSAVLGVFGDLVGVVHYWCFSWTGYLLACVWDLRLVGLLAGLRWFEVWFGSLYVGVVGWFGG